MKLIQPYFINNQSNGDDWVQASNQSVLGNDNHPWSVKGAVDTIGRDIILGVKDILIFVMPDRVDLPDWDLNKRVVSEIKAAHGDKVNLHVDICLCSTTLDGHCCYPEDTNKTDEQLFKQASVVYEAGADVLAPSDCQDNTVKNIKERINKVNVMSYSTKFRSQLYDGFRQTIGVEKGIHRSYQLDVNDRELAIARSVKYFNDGANSLMVKPGMTSIDLIMPIKEATKYRAPVGVYQTSGEYIGLQRNTCLVPELLKETHDVFKRAGANFMITYGARELHKQAAD